MVLPGRVRGSQLTLILQNLHRAQITGTLALYELAGVRAGRVHRIFFREGRVHDVEMNDDGPFASLAPNERSRLSETHPGRRLHAIQSLFALADLRLTFHAAAWPLRASCVQWHAHRADPAVAPPHVC